MSLPKGQRFRSDFPLFGLPHFANRLPTSVSEPAFQLSLNDVHTLRVDLSSTSLPRVTVTADFHCVTTWSYPQVTWSGVGFRSLYTLYCAYYRSQSTTMLPPIRGAVIYAQDGCRTTLSLKDLLSDDVLIADTLGKQPLPAEHGAPLRLIAPAHYGYKSIKHVTKVSFYTKRPVIKTGLLWLLDHPRARVHKEERGRLLPQLFLRYVYRQLIASTVKRFKDATRHEKR